MTPAVRAQLDEALHDPAPLWTLEDVVRAVETENAQLWNGPRSCMVTQVQDYPTGERVLDVWLAAGDLDEIMEARPQVEAWAQAAGCTQIHITGRPGWARLLREHGYEHWATVVRKVIA